MERYVCIHGHFYQPPRENPWLESIEVQDSAYPFHDWNERITDECYGPNAWSRILDDQRRIVEIVNNYSRINFNFGPTLLAWMEEHAPWVYQATLEADRRSQERFSGHGSAMAQVYNHMIMPLASRNDKITQVVWGIRDFEYRFGRKPEGMWLAETAVDTETLDILAEQGIAFTILAPNQASRVREIGGQTWCDVSGSQVDPTTPYIVGLPSGRTITVFFYDGPVSRAVAFEGLLTSGERLAGRIVDTFSDEREWPQLAHIATDGETYGHHHRHGEMALSYALRYIEEHELARITNYSEFLTMHPPIHEVEIVEDSSWSCVHGVERWRSDCGCNTGMNPGWNQQWRQPLREALDWLRDSISPEFDEHAAGLLEDPWAARDDYIDVIIDRSSELVEQFLKRHAISELDEADRVRVLKLMELQRHAMLMYTSCGWFFDELSGIETVQVIQYAGRVIQLAEDLFGGNFETRFVELLAHAKSNLPAERDGELIYRRSVVSARVELTTVGAHYAMSSLFYDDEDRTAIYCYLADPWQYEYREAGRARLAVGQVRLASQITGESGLLSFGVLHLGEQILDGGVREFIDDTSYAAMLDEVTEAFDRADFPATIRLLDHHFGDHSYSLETLFRDEQRRIVNIILGEILGDAESSYRHIYNDNAALMRFLDGVGVPMPRALRTAAEFVMNLDILRAVEDERFDPQYIRDYFEETSTWNLELDMVGLSFALEQTIERIASGLPNDAGIEELIRLNEAIDLAHALPFDVNFWTTQNLYYEALQLRYPVLLGDAGNGDDTATAWVERFTKLGNYLSVKVA